VAEPVVVQAEKSLFLDPFEGERHSALLRFEGGALAKGALLWQGKGNGYDDKRLLAYVAPEAEATPAKQPHQVWARLWGKPGEQGPLLVDWPAGPLWTFPAERPQLDRLRHPQGLARAGADLGRLGLLLKKKTSSPVGERRGVSPPVDEP